MTNPLSMTLCRPFEINSFSCHWIRLPFPDFLIVTLNNSSRNTCNLKYDESIYGMVYGQLYSSLIRCGIYHRI